MSSVVLCQVCLHFAEDYFSSNTQPVSGRNYVNFIDLLCTFCKDEISCYNYIYFMLKSQNLNTHITLQIFVCSLIVILTFFMRIAGFICRLWTHLSSKASLYFLFGNNTFKMLFVDNSSVIICSAVFKSFYLRITVLEHQVLVLKD